MRYFLWILLVWSNIYATQRDDFVAAYKAKEYLKACKAGSKMMAKGERNEQLLSLVGYACMQADYTNTLEILQNRLRSSKEARENATLFSALVLQVRLIYQYLHDGVDISKLYLPVAEHPLSKAFVAIRDGKVEKKSLGHVVFYDAKRRYDVYIDPTPPYKLAIDVTDENGNKEEHRYR